MFGNVIGHGPHRLIEDVPHHTNLFLCKIGATSESRKGSSTGRVQRLFFRVHPNVRCEWHDNERYDWHVTGGLLSGEGLVENLRDASDELDDNGNPVEPGVPDKRLMLIESEFARVLTACAREFNALSYLIRQAWETGNMRNLGRQSKARATGAHVSIIGDVTPDELLDRLTIADIYNGFANRFFFIYTQRTKFLAYPDSPNPAVMEILVDRLSKAIEFARGVDQVAFRPLAAAMYESIYAALTAPSLAGMVQTMLARSAPQVIRLAMIYALLDCKRRIDAPHLRAALALWEYSERSVQYIFGKSTGDSTADTILNALREQDDKGLSRTAINELFSKHGGKRVDSALETGGQRRGYRYRRKDRWPAASYLSRHI
jgi:hypothetical protein